MMTITVYRRWHDPEAGKEGTIGRCGQIAEPVHQRFSSGQHNKHEDEPGKSTTNNIPIVNDESSDFLCRREEKYVSSSLDGNIDREMDGTKQSH